jgi:predicted transcriptional regulator
VSAYDPKSRKAVLYQKQIDDLKREVTELKKVAHAPFDFSDLIRRLENLENRVSGLLEKNIRIR